MIGILVVLALPSTAAAQVFLWSNLPIIEIEVSGDIPDEPKVPGRIRIVDGGAGAENRRTDPAAYDGPMAIELRGSSSRVLFPKKSFAIELKDENGSDTDASLLGLPPEEDWVLHGPYSDRTYMRNVLAMELSRAMGQYASRTRFVEVFLNNAYHGLYVLMERIKRDSARVDVSRLRPEEVLEPEVSGGYIIKVDKLDGAGNDGWTSAVPPRIGSADRVVFQYHYPKGADLVDVQKAWIQQWMTRFEEEMASRPERWQEYLEPSAAVDYLLLNELTHNVDSYRLSTFMHKDRDDDDEPRLRLGPVWDFNLAFGNADYYDGRITRDWRVQYRLPDGDFQPPAFFRRVFRQDSFQDLARTRWAELRNSFLHTDSLLARIDGHAETIRAAYERDRLRWGQFGRYIWPNVFVGQDLDDEVAYLKSWLLARLAWMDDALDPGSGVPDGAPQLVAGQITVTGPYPNPVSGTARLVVGLSPSGWMVVTLHDVLGREVRQVFRGFPESDAFQELILDTTGLPNGLHFLRIRSTGRLITHALHIVR
ncbi:MAG: CotH kinase family protein [Rhodothermales bacterium]|nr:CotH kinase family protein [Rhodothermales bacterium]